MKKDTGETFSMTSLLRILLALLGLAGVGYWLSMQTVAPPPPPAVTTQTPSKPDTKQTELRRADLKFLTDKIAERYVYAADRKIDAQAIYDEYAPAIDRVEDEYGWTLFLEPVIGELFDHHAFLGANTDVSPRLVPSGADVWPEYVEGVAMITSVRPGSPAAKAGLKPGMRITAFNGAGLGEEFQTRMPRALKEPTLEARNYALQALLAGVRGQPRVVTACIQTSCEDYKLANPDFLQSGKRVTWRKLDGNVGYIRFENSLGDDATVAEFDAAAAALGSAGALIIDLRDTPGGGNTSVAEPILGRFVDKTTAYQKVYTPGRGWWDRVVEPRGPLVKAPLYVLVDRWTGSMGEGMAVGFDGMKRGLVVGTRMAGLKGAIEDFKLPNTKVIAKFPVEKLAHLNGTPREDWAPPVLVDQTKYKVPDPILHAALFRIFGRN
jgi:carboxyl-terminal processing protease